MVMCFMFAYDNCCNNVTKRIILKNLNSNKRHSNIYPGLTSVPFGTLYRISPDSGDVNSQEGSQ